MEKPASAEASITFGPFRADKRPAEGFGAVAFSGPPCVPARLADSAGFRRAAAKKTRECVWMRGCWEVFDAKFVFSKQNCMDYGILSGYILDNNSPERPTRGPEHALARLLAASRVNPIETQMCPRNPAGTSAFSLGCLRTVGPAGWSCLTSGPHERTSVPLFTGAANPSFLAGALRGFLLLLELSAGVGDGVVDVRAEAILAH